MNDTEMSQGEYEVREAQVMAVAKREPDMPMEHVKPTQTPAQARVDAVAHVLHEAWSKASTLQLSQEETAQLKADFPMEAFKRGAGGDPNLIYIEHAFLRDRFDNVFGIGQWALVRTRPHWGEDFVTQKGQKATRIYADCALLIRGCWVSEAIGDMVYYPNNASQSYGDAAEGAETAAFRRCAKKIGVGLQAWKKDFCAAFMATEGTTQRVAYKPQPAPQPKPAPQQETPAQKKARFLRLFGPYAQYATEVFRNVGLILDTEEYDSISETKVGSFTGHDVNMLLSDVKRAAGASDQVPGAEVPEPAPEPMPEPQRDPMGPPEGTESVVGKLMAISKKEGKGNNGKPWTRYGIMLQDGDNKQWINTFDKKLADVATSLKGQEVEAFVKRNDKGFMDLVGFA